MSLALRFREPVGASPGLLTLAPQEPFLGSGVAQATHYLVAMWRKPPGFS